LLIYEIWGKTLNKKEKEGVMLSRIGIQIAVACSSLMILMIIGTVAYRFLEDWTWIQSFYFSVVTLSTVGYGDLSPTSDASRLFTASYIIGGVAIALSALGVIGTNYLRKRESRILERREKRGNSL
jgi:hypothetical protein